MPDIKTPGKIAERTVHTCAFCGGRGKDPFELLSKLSNCQVCGGRGKVDVAPPAIECAFCGGTGIHRDQRLTCVVCGGKGMVTIEKGSETETCPDCGGKGVVKGDYLPCVGCGGTGVIARAAPAPGAKSGKKKKAGSKKQKPARS